MASSKLTRAHDTLVKNRADALDLVQDVGVEKTRVILKASADDLKLRIKAQIKANPGTSFTLTQLKATLAQVTQVTRDLVVNVRDTILEAGEQAAEQATGHTVEYLLAADKAFRGVGTQPLALREASMFEEATTGVKSSILMRLASSGEPGAEEDEHPAKPGVLARYGVQTIGAFEQQLQMGLVTRKTWGQMAKDITEQSPFLQGAPASWATRIVRTEVMGAYGRATWESNREADQQLGDMVKIWSETFDDRTAADSYANHGAIRRPEEPFETWYGYVQFPPMRPNDRAIIVSHRISWPIPEYLEWRTDEEIDERWKYDGRKGEPPDRPEMTTVSLERFGQVQDKPPELEGETPAAPEDEDSDED